MEIALDRNAATERLHFGLVYHGGSKSGHAWLDSDPTTSRSYAVTFTL